MQYLTTQAPYCGMLWTDLLTSTHTAPFMPDVMKKQIDNLPIISKLAWINKATLI